MELTETPCTHDQLARIIPPLSDGPTYICVACRRYAYVTHLDGKEEPTK